MYIYIYIKGKNMARGRMARWPGGRVAGWPGCLVVSWLRTTLVVWIFQISLNMARPGCENIV